MTGIRQQKMELRYVMELKRAEALTRDLNATIKLRDNFMNTIKIPPDSIVASYCAKGTEIDPAPLTEALRAKGHAIAFPIVTEKNLPLSFRLHKPGDKLVKNKIGIPEPLADAPEANPDIFLVPLLAFDRRGYRLGYGGGYYDRTLLQARQHKNILAIGLAFADQEIPEIPTGYHDVRLDKIVTEIQAY